jgi:L-asparaginase/Glu-tRNA(Gln) amidotransferase subunit D
VPKAKRRLDLGALIVLSFHTGTRPGLANALVAAGAKGIVIASVGAGSLGNLDK